MKKIKTYVFFLFVIINFNAHANDLEFEKWKEKFKLIALERGVSLNTIENTVGKSSFLKNVIKYDRYQPEFYEDTSTYINKRVNKKKIKKGRNLYNKNKDIINEIENKFLVEKELLLALMGIETNYGNYLGKMDIVSSLATLGYDKRRSEFFTNELLTVLILVEEGLIDHEILFGSWAGAFGNFQFMPRTIRNYAIDYNKNKTIELKKTEDSFASAANYLSKIGWKKNQPCYYKISLKKNTPLKYLNSSARNIKNKKKIIFFKKYINDFENLRLDGNLFASIIIPDKDIIPGAKTLSPAYIVFDNYEKILKWNRSLRFALAVCTLKDGFKNEI